jgi:LacI family transcriptional regulator
MNYLRREISGRSITRSVTRDDVAKLAGVSVATVSYVLNNGPRQVRPETRAKVLEAVETLGYRPSAVARSLRTNKTFTVGLIVTDILNPFHSAVAKAVEEAARDVGYTLVLCNSDEDDEQELTYLRVLESKRVDGIILVPTGGNVSYLQDMIRKHWNLVLLDRSLASLQTDSVVMDNRQGAFDAVSHLIGLGHRRIALLGAPSNLTPGRERQRGYQDALSAAGIPLDPSLIFEASFKAKCALDSVRALLDASPRPTAIFVANNLLALDIMRVVRERGLSVPDDIALCVFDDVEYYSLMSPTITAVGYSIRDLARAGFRLLLERMTEQGMIDTPRHEVVPCRLTIRQSTTRYEMEQ